VLLDRGANLETKNKHGETALMLAASNAGTEDLEVVATLINRGADLRAKDNQGRTAIDKAVAKGRKQIVLLLKAAIAKAR
jgi:ankyrin repeat protein